MLVTEEERERKRCEESRGMRRESVKVAKESEKRKEKFVQGSRE